MSHTPFACYNFLMNWNFWKKLLVIISYFIFSNDFSLKSIIFEIIIVTHFFIVYICQLNFWILNLINILEY